MINFIKVHGSSLTFLVNNDNFIDVHGEFMVKLDEDKLVYFNSNYGF